MTIAELFEEIRHEHDWSKTVAVWTKDGPKEIAGSVPNIIDDTQIFLLINDGDEKEGTK